MGKKKPVMSQPYTNSNNEFIFGESGGKGKNLSLFLRNLSLTGSPLSSKSSSGPYNSSESISAANSKIYGSLGYSNPTVAGASAHISSNIPTRPKNHRVSSSSSSLGLVLARTASRHGLESSPTVLPGLPVTRPRPGGRTAALSRYTDLDDDWDDQFDINVTSTKQSPVSPKHESAPSSPMQAAADVAPGESGISQSTRQVKFTRVLSPSDEDANINTQDLRALLWNGIPSDFRAFVWQVLLGYLPTNRIRHAATLKRKRQEYLEGIAMAPVDFSKLQPDKALQVNENESNLREKQLYHQINIDVKRTNPTDKLYSYPETQMSLRKVLYLWAVRHPASGYVQGINDLCTPFYLVFIQSYLRVVQCKAKNEPCFFSVPDLIDESGCDDVENALLTDPDLQTYTLDNLEPSKISLRVFSLIEADIYWCLSRLLETITDNYIHEQPGIIRQLGELRNLISKIDPELLQHFENEGVEFIQFAFRWMNCLLMREIPMNRVIRMWDAYISENPLGFNNFHVYVCAAFLIKFSAELKQMEFQDILLFLQNPPTSAWTEKDIELMLSEAFIWQSLYKNAGAHLRS